MVVKMKSIISPDKHPVVTRRKGGGTLINSRPQFSSDSKHVFVNCGWGVRVFSIKTGECIRALETGSEDERLAGIAALHNNPIGVTSNGVIIKWDLKSGKVEKNVLTLKEGYVPTEALLVPSPISHTKEALCIPQFHEAKSEIIVGFYEPSKGVRIKHPIGDRKIGTTPMRHGISFGGFQEQPIMAVISSKYLNVFSLDGKDTTETELSAGHNKTWTCVRCHSTETAIAAGDNLGRVLLWRNVFSKSGSKPCAVFHWHTLPCIDIAFTPMGSSMYTGGGENVLVKWNVENPNVKHFLPRLSADIVHITVAPDNQLIAVATLDNGIQIVEAQHRLRCVLQQLTWGVLPTPKAKLFPAGLQYDPRSRALVLNGRPGHLQFYTPQTETLLFNIDITQQNYLTQERENVILNTEVTHSAMSSDGSWLATIESRHDKDVSLELRLKLWQYIPSKHCFSLNSSIESPHNGLAHSLLFRPGSDTLKNSEEINLDYMLVSTGYDHKFRMWTPSAIDSVYKKGVMWGCESIGRYRDKKCGPMSFSEDGSLLAVGFNQTLTIWDTDDVQIKTSMTRHSDPLRLVEFGRNECSHFVVTCTDEEISVWNLLSVTLVWKKNLRVALLVSDPKSCYMAVISKDKSALVLSPNSEELSLVENKICKGKEVILGAIFVPREKNLLEVPQWLQYSQLYYIDSNQELKVFEGKDEINDVSSLQLTQDREVGTLFSALVAAQKDSHVKQDKPKHLQFGVLGANAVTQLLKAPAHTMPPVSLLCGSLLQALAVTKKTKEVEMMEISEDEGISETAKGEDSSLSESEEEKKTVKASTRKKEKKPVAVNREQPVPPKIETENSTKISIVPKTSPKPERIYELENGEVLDFEGDTAIESLRIFADLKGDIDNFSYK